MNANIVTGNAVLEVKVSITLTEKEARFLNSLASYGSGAMSRAFKEIVGSSVNFDDTARSLCGALRSQLAEVLRRADNARAVFDGTKIAKEPGTSE